MEWFQTFFRNVGLVISGIVLGAIILGLSDRSPPVVVHNYSLSKPFYKAGDILNIDWSLKRDITRECDVTIYAEVMDKNKNKLVYVPSKVPSELLVIRDKASPEVSKVSRKIPYMFEPGIAHYNVLLEYECNAMHKVWPIRVPLTVQFTIIE